MIKLAFDIYGTLIDTSSIKPIITELVGSISEQFNILWRNKQLEYSFRRSAMRSYIPFSMITRQALIYTNSQLNTNLNQSGIDRLMNAYLELSVFDDVVQILKKLKSQNCELYAFSNGNKESLTSLFQKNNIQAYFDDLISVEEIKIFKPAPDVYKYLINKINGSPNKTHLISGNSFDIIGASNVGLKTIWIDRSKNAQFDPWEFQPNHTINSLTELQNIFQTA
ncbi:haloacid dehalogenase type II [Marinigracilibium pacificum]|uniref:Haloacid dehalogenase type II n=1 Tax=Marinigracilibium pacificum TaxID=2729599 RepID=A0A848IYH8_9BACT|nr:haloacid dehalogenase type II [Marinigracilibium pacificum]NMM47350.1 haloacid dehalogenase type II [Marinigracilibium pacificum]